MDLDQAVAQLTTAATEAAEAARTSGATAARVESSLQALRQIVVDNHQATTNAHALLRRDFGVLWRKVNGSTPPPPGGTPSAPPEEAGAVPLADLAEEAHRLGSAASLDLASLEGAVIAGFSEEARARKELREEIMTELQKQSTALGIGVRGLFAFLRTREGRSFVAALATVVAALAGILGTYSQVRAHAEAPAAALPAPSQVR